MMIVPDVGCKKCKSKINVIEHIIIKGFDSARIEHCECKDYFFAQLRVNDPREKEIKGILSGAGLGAKKVAALTNEIRFIMDPFTPGFGSKVECFNSEEIDAFWKVITKRWPSLEDVQSSEGRFEYECKINLDLLMLEVFKNSEIKKITDHDVNRLFRWPLALIAASGRLHVGDECWRLE